MTSLQETITLPQWVVDDTDDFLTVLQNDLTGGTQSQMTYFEKNFPGMHESPYNNKVKAEYDQKNIEIDQILSSLTQQDHQICVQPVQQLSEPERIDRMNETEVIDYLVDLMIEEPSDPKTKPYQPNEKGNNESQSGNLENSHIQNTMQYTEIKELCDTNIVQTDILENSHFQNTSQFTGVEQLPNTNLVQIDAPENGNFQHTNNQRSINQYFNNEDHTRVDLKNTQNRLNNKAIYIQNATPSIKHKYIINKNINHVPSAPVEKRVKTIDTKKLIEIVQAQNKAFFSKRAKVIDKVSNIQQKSTLQNQAKMPTLNKEKELSTNIQAFNMSSKVVEVKLDIEKKNSETTSTKKRKRYEEEPKGDEEEEKKIFQAKKAKNYREKKKEEFKMKDIQIKNLQEALQKSEREKRAYMNENKQLKEDLKKKDVLLQLYEVN